MRRLLLILLVMMAIPFVACRQEKKVGVGNINPRNMPTMRTVNVSTLISDSGVTQYKIVSPLWLVYDNVDTPYWLFPKGLYLQKYDRMFNVIATIACDSAKYFKREKLWRLDGRVEITRVPKDLFQTEQLFWNERTHMLYTDSFIHIENLTHMIEGKGFRSNDALSDYRIVTPTGIFPVQTNGDGAAGAPSPATEQPLTAIP